MNKFDYSILQAISEGTQIVFKRKKGLSHIDSKMRYFALAVERLHNAGLIKNEIITDGADKPGPFFASIQDAVLTPLGKNIINKT